MTGSAATGRREPWSEAWANASNIMCLLRLWPSLGGGLVGESFAAGAEGGLGPSRKIEFRERRLAIRSADALAKISPQAFPAIGYRSVHGIERMRGVAVYSATSSARSSGSSLWALFKIGIEVLETLLGS